MIYDDYSHDYDNYDDYDDYDDYHDDCSHDYYRLRQILHVGMFAC